MTSTPVRVGLIGYGFSGKTFHAPLINSVPELSLTLIGSSDPAKVQADLPGIRVESDPHAVAASGDVDLVVIATPNDTHAPVARAAIEAGKHVVVDKPFTLDMAEARELIALAKRKGVLLSVFHNRRWDSDFLTIREAIADRLVGTVTHFESHIDRFRPQVRDRWRERGGAGSGLWFDLGPHLVDQAIQLFGLPDRVQTNLAQQRTGALAPDWAHAVLDYGERRVILHATMLSAGGSARFVVHGNAGSVLKSRADIQEDQLRTGMRPGAPGWGGDPDPLVVYDANGSRREIPALPGDQRNYYRGVVDALDGDPLNLVTPIQALAVMAVIEAGFESARAQSSATISLTPEERTEIAAS